MGSDVINLISIEYDKDGNMVLVVEGSLFDAIKSAIESKKVRKYSNGRRVAINIHKMSKSLKVKGVEFMLLTDQPPCK